MKSVPTNQPSDKKMDHSLINSRCVNWSKKGTFYILVVIQMLGEQISAANLPFIICLLAS